MARSAQPVHAVQPKALVRLHLHPRKAALGHHVHLHKLACRVPGGGGRLLRVLYVATAGWLDAWQPYTWKAICRMHMWLYQLWHLLCETNLLAAVWHEHATWCRQAIVPTAHLPVPLCRRPRHRCPRAPVLQHRQLHQHLHRLRQHCPPCCCPPFLLPFSCPSSQVAHPSTGCARQKRSGGTLPPPVQWHARPRLRYCWRPAVEVVWQY
jgi:hypothetical protein